MSIRCLPWNQPFDRAERPAVRDDEIELTYAGLADHVQALAA